MLAAPYYCYLVCREHSHFFEVQGNKIHGKQMAVFSDRHVNGIREPEPERSGDAGAGHFCFMWRPTVNMVVVET